MFCIAMRFAHNQKIQKSDSASTHECQSTNRSERKHRRLGESNRLHVVDINRCGRIVGLAVEEFKPGGNKSLSFKRGQRNIRKSVRTNSIKGDIQAVSTRSQGGGCCGSEEAST